MVEQAGRGAGAGAAERSGAGRRRAARERIVSGRGSLRGAAGLWQRDADPGADARGLGMDAVGARTPGFALCTAAAAALAGLYHHLRTDSGDRHGRDNGDFQPGEYGAAAAAAVSGVEPVGLAEPA